MNRFTRAITGAAVIAVMAASTLLVAGPASAATDGHFTYTTNDLDSTATITQYSGPNGAVVVPQMIGGYTVTTLGAYSFASKDLTAVTIPGSVLNMGENALGGQSGLTSITFLGKTAPAIVGAINGPGDLVIYYNPGATGFSNAEGEPFEGYTFSELPTPVWDISQTTANAIVVAGTRTASLSALTFDEADVSHADEDTTATSTLSVNDLSGSGAGWSVTVQASNLVWSANGGSANANNDIAAENLSVAVSTVTGGTSESDASLASKVTPGVAGSLNNPVSIMSAGSGFGEGAYSSALIFTLNIPANSHNGLYSGTLTTTVSVAPVD